MSTFYLWECGCGTRTFLTSAGGTINECDCAPRERHNTMTSTKLVTGETVPLRDKLGPYREPTKMWREGHEWIRADKVAA